MYRNSNTPIVLSLIAIVIAITGCFTPVGQKVVSNGVKALGGMTGLAGLTITPIESTDGVKIGSNGSTYANIKSGACTIWAPATTIAASTSQQIVCQSATDGSIGSITGVTTDSVCNLMMASSTNTTSNSISLQGISASSTAGTLVGRLSNLTGTTFTWSAAASSSSQWNYLCFDPI